MGAGTVLDAVRLGRDVALHAQGSMRRAGGLEAGPQLRVRGVDDREILAEAPLPTGGAVSAGGRCPAAAACPLERSEIKLAWGRAGHQTGRKAANVLI